MPSPGAFMQMQGALADLWLRARTVAQSVAALAGVNAHYEADEEAAAPLSPPLSTDAPRPLHYLTAENDPSGLFQAVQSQSMWDSLFRKLSLAAAKAYDSSRRERMAQRARHAVARVALRAERWEEALPLLRDAWNFYSSQGWTALGRPHLANLALCHRMLGEPDEEVRLLLRLLAAGEDCYADLAAAAARVEDGRRMVVDVSELGIVDATFVPPAAPVLCGSVVTGATMRLSAAPSLGAALRVSEFVFKFSSAAVALDGDKEEDGEEGGVGAEDAVELTCEGGATIDPNVDVVEVRVASTVPLSRVGQFLFRTVEMRLFDRVSVSASVRDGSAPLVSSVATASIAMRIVNSRLLRSVAQKVEVVVEVRDEPVHSGASLSLSGVSLLPGADTATVRFDATRSAELALVRTGNESARVEFGEELPAGARVSLVFPVLCAQPHALCDLEFGFSRAAAGKRFSVRQAERLSLEPALSVHSFVDAAPGREANKAIVQVVVTSGSEAPVELRECKLHVPAALRVAVALPASVAGEVLHTGESIAFFHEVEFGDVAGGTGGEATFRAAFVAGGEACEHASEVAGLVALAAGRSGDAAYSVDVTHPSVSEVGAVVALDIAVTRGAEGPDGPSVCVAELVVDPDVWLLVGSPSATLRLAPGESASFSAALFCVSAGSTPVPPVLLSVGGSRVASVRSVGRAIDVVPSPKSKLGFHELET